MQPEPLTHPELTITHGFFTRKGGISCGLHASLNCGFGSDDDPGTIDQNRRRVAKFLTVSPDDLVTVHQIHSTNVVVVENIWPKTCPPQGDAMVTSRTGIALGILTADCIPVLLADTTHGVIGAAHAGWKGALGGILEATVEAMEVQGARRKNITAVVGPCIAQASYEVGPEFRAVFVGQDPDHAVYFRPSTLDRHYQFDLAGFAMHRLKRLALRRCSDLARDTYAEAELFFSYRRSCHRHEGDYGRQISAIAITP